MLNSAGARGMDVSMVIAAWGEGVGVHVSPSPSPDRSSSAKTRVKIAGWVPGHAPIRCARLRPPRAQLEKYDKIFGRTFSFVLTHVCDSTHSLAYHWLKIDIWNIINIVFFSFMKIYVLRICNVQ